jgi:hypothetical protein
LRLTYIHTQLHSAYFQALVQICACFGITNTYL